MPVIRLHEEVKRIRFADVTPTEVNTDDPAQLFSRFMARYGMNLETPDFLEGLSSDKLTGFDRTLQEIAEATYQKGCVEGRNSAGEALESRIECFQRTVIGLKYEFEAAIRNMHKPLLQVALKVAECILGVALQEKDLQDSFLSRQLQELLGNIAAQNKVTIHLNHKQLRGLNTGEFAKALPFDGEIVFKENEQLKAGECLLETDDFFIEGTIDRQIELLEKGLLKQGLNA